MKILFELSKEIEYKCARFYIFAYNYIRTEQKQKFSTMNRIIYLGCLICIIALSSCKKETYRHVIALDYPNGAKICYADQIKDSIIFNTFDSYEVTPQSNWIKTNYDYGMSSSKISNTYYVAFNVTVGINISPNNTGKCRIGFVGIKSYCEDWDQTINATFCQYAWHNINRPSGIYSFADGMTSSARFELREAGNCKSDSIEFTTYLDWDIEVPENSFVHPVKTYGRAGNQVVRLNFDENTSYKLDSVELKLITPDYGIETPIWIYRNPKNK